MMKLAVGVFLFAVLNSVWQINSCSDFFMNFSDPSLRISVRTSDLTSYSNWTLTPWPKTSRFKSKVIGDWEQPALYNTLGLSVNWIGDERFGFPSFFGDSLNEQGLSCSLLALVDSQYEEYDVDKINVFNGVFCLYVTQRFSNVFEVQDALDGIAIYGPDFVAEHYVVRDAQGMSLVIELLGGRKVVYLDKNDGVNGFGIMTNEPPFDYHLTNVKHYQWKRSLSRQAVPVPGSFYPEERYLRVHMVKEGMQDLMSSSATVLQAAVSLATQVLNTVTVPMGAQYGTDSSGENKQDHTVLGLIRDHSSRVLYWRDGYNPTLRRIRLEDLFGADDTTTTPGCGSVEGFRSNLPMKDGPFFVDMAAEMSEV